MFISLGVAQQLNKWSWNWGKWRPNISPCLTRWAVLPRSDWTHPMTRSFCFRSLRTFVPGCVTSSMWRGEVKPVLLLPQLTSCTRLWHWHTACSLSWGEGHYRGSISRNNTASCLVSFFDLEMVWCFTLYRPWPLLCRDYSLPHLTPFHAEPFKDIFVHVDIKVNIEPLEIFKTAESHHWNHHLLSETVQKLLRLRREEAEPSLIWQKQIPTYLTSYLTSSFRSGVRYVTHMNHHVLWPSSQSTESVRRPSLSTFCMLTSCLLLLKPSTSHLTVTGEEVSVRTVIPWRGGFI